MLRGGILWRQTGGAPDVVIRASAGSDVGSVLTAVMSGTGLTVTGWTWKRDGSPIAGASGSTSTIGAYTLTEADQGHRISIDVSVQQSASAAIGVAAAVTLSAALTVAGTAIYVNGTPLYIN